jgi:drug/metabolite transporter (DMT)-like permease
MPAFSRTSLVPLAAICAVLMWSLKPVFITLLGDRATFVEAYLLSAVFAVVGGAVVMAVRWPTTMAVLRAGRFTWRALVSCTASGAFLGLWYYGFYRALYGAPKVDATIIAFTWPLIAVVAIQMLTPRMAERRLTLAQWGLILVAMTGAALVSVSGVGVAGEWNAEILWAFAAALGSGLYLPFAVKATGDLRQAAGSAASATFYAIALANAAALLVVVLALAATGSPITVPKLDAGTVVLCALIGLGTYLIAEVTWTWALQAHRSLALVSLPYYSPAVSVLLLWALFGEHVGVLSVLGLGLVLGANLILHRPAKPSSRHPAPAPT